MTYEQYNKQKLQYQKEQIREDKMAKWCSESTIS